MDNESRLGWFAAMFSMVVFAAVACGGADDGDGNGNGASDGGGTTKTGTVSIMQTRSEAAGEETVNYSAQAGFVETISEGEGSCETTEEGSCTVEVCDGEGGDGGEVEHRSAGEITVSGGAQEITMTKETDTYTTSGSGEVWTNDDTLTVEAAGDEVPAFTGELQPPANATLTSPETPDGAWEIDTTSDIDVEWDAEEIDSGEFTVNLVNTGDPGSSLYCIWDVTSGSETIPASLLGEMSTGAEGSYNFTVDAETSVSADDWDVEIRAFESFESGTATFE